MSSKKLKFLWNSGTFLVVLINNFVESTFNNKIKNFPNLLNTIDNQTCPIGYFKCQIDGESKCIAQHLNCNDIVNCDDGADEEHCDDKDEAVFWDMKYRKQPSALSDDIPIGKCSFKFMNSTCPCRGKDLLCKFQHLNELPNYLPDEGISLLDLTGNHFPILKRNFFSTLQPTEIIVMEFCNIVEVESFTFEPFSKNEVKQIILDHNEITNLPENLFDDKNLVRILFLASNKINILHEYDFRNLHNLVKLDLRRNEIKSFSLEVFKPLEMLESLLLDGNYIQVIHPGLIPSLNNLRILGLAENHIELFEPKSFNLINLSHLFLSSNKLSTIQSKSFCGLENLIVLKLDNNEILKLEPESFTCIENLTSLDLTENRFRTLDRKLFRNLTKLNHTYFSYFHLCGAVPHVRNCEPKTDGISSAYHLLDSIILRTSVWIMSAIAVIGNSIVLIGRFFSKSRRNVDQTLYLRHLAGSDFLMGIYLAAIATADIEFRGEYLIHEEQWRHSIACSICGFLSTLSCQSSTLLLTLITWDRLISVTQPLQPRTTTKALVILRLSMLWGISIIVAFAPFLYDDYFGDYFYGSNGVCLSLHIHDPYAKGWEYSAVLFIIINTFSLIFIVISYFRMLQAIRGSGKAMRSTVSGRENVFARRFAVIVATDCACWLPIIIVKLAALCGMKIPASLYAWLAVLVLPVNSALNPILYTLTTASFKQQLVSFIQIRRYVWTKQSDTRISRSNTAYESAYSTSMGQFTNGASSRKKLLQRNLSYV
ncbi:relaxin receptor 1 [Condylostylus longicornis]|uniref:relaxin receptor 1 n=1 Tax=Condylostylus longicornis TaxID=2530218 RepID=UPI00244DBBA0|nr:relaxin receptor 1 [Condylostylus longicornis]